MRRRTSTMSSIYCYEYMKIPTTIEISIIRYKIEVMSRGFIFIFSAYMIQTMLSMTKKPQDQMDTFWAAWCAYMR